MRETERQRQSDRDREIGRGQCVTLHRRVVSGRVAPKRQRNVHKKGVRGEKERE